jgi:CheY-like chemotaxis protein
MTIPTQEQRAALENQTILVLEDEMMVAMLLEDMLGDLGCRVLGPVSMVGPALELLAGNSVDAALLDVNLSYGQNGYPVAEELTARGIPFAFVTGYGADTLNPQYSGRPTLQKPFHMAALTETLVAMATATV